MAGLLVVAGVAWQALWLGWPAAMVSVGLVASWLLWRSGRWEWSPRLLRAAAIALIAFVVHVAEEVGTGMSDALPALFARTAWSDARLLVFNLAWLGVFLVALVSARPGRRLPLLPLVFLGLVGGVANGIIHLALVAAQGGYFPGAWTAPLVFVAGLSLLGAMRPESQVAVEGRSG